MRFTMPFVFLLAVTAPALALPPQSNHGNLQAVPVPGAVKIDGSLDDWDRSAAMLVYPVRALRERYSVRVHAMWDKDALYLGLVWRDPTPMLNKVDPDAAPHEGWMSDAFQGRFTTDQQVHLTAWYASVSRKSVAVLDYQNAASPSPRKTYRAEGVTIDDPSGIRQAFQVSPDGRGYTQELRLPWSVLSKKPAIQAGQKFRFSGEYFWGSPRATLWPGVMWADPVDQRNPVRIVLYQSPQAWGELELLSKGNLPAPPVDEEDARLQGPIPIRLEVPADADRVTVAIDSADGTRVRNLLSHGKVADYLVPNSPRGKRLIEVPWDGRADGSWDKSRMLFLGDVLPAGEYRVRSLVHSGLGATYAMSFYCPGQPPWETADGTGGWGFDHTNPTAVAALPPEAKGKVRVFLGWPHGECGCGLIGLDETGRRHWGWTRRGVGAEHLAATSGKLFAIHSGHRKLSAFEPETGRPLKFGKETDLTLPALASGLAASPKSLAVALGKVGKVLFLDPATGAMLREVKVPDPGELVFLPNGALRGLAAKKCFEIAPNADSPTPVELPGVQSPLALATDTRGQMYVADAATQTIRVLAPSGKSTTLGTPGGRQPGPWQPERMSPVRSLAAVESTAGTRIWAVEEGLSPRRVSVWKPDGKLATDFIGNTRYCATGGLLSDDDPELGLVDGVLFRLDHGRQTYRPLEIMGGHPQPKEGKHALFAVGRHVSDFGNGNHFLSDVSGKPHAYYVEASGSACAVFMKRQERWICVAALGRGDVMRWPAGFAKAPKPHAIWAWNDLDGDGFQSPNELTWFDPERPDVFKHKGWGYRCGKDLTFHHSGFAFQPTRFGNEGEPIYEPAKATRLPGDLDKAGDIHKTRFGYVANLHATGKYNVIDKNNVIHGLGLLTGFDARGRRMWTYPNYWQSVHGAMTAPMAMPGVIMGTLKISGVFPLHANGKDTGRDVISLRGNIGQEFLLRDDGLYLGELFTDQRMAPESLPAETDLTRVVGFPLNETTLGGEPFNGWIGRQKDGKVRLTYGYTDVRVAEVTGLDRIRDLKTEVLKLDAAMVAKARAFVPKMLAGDGPREYDVVRGAAAWPVTAIKGIAPLVLRSGREEVGRAWITHDDTHLHLTVQVLDTTPLQNKGSEAALAFTTGDGVSLFVAPDKAKTGGARVLLTVLAGKPTAVVYRPNGPGDRPYTFQSPVRSVKFGHVAEESAIKIKTALLGSPTPREYALTASVPWSVLGVQPKAGLVLRGDVGIQFSDDTGGRTARRTQWCDRETNVVNDVPTEAEFTPARWGTIRLK